MSDMEVRVGKLEGAVNDLGVSMLVATRDIRHTSEEARSNAAKLDALHTRFDEQQAENNTRNVEVAAQQNAIQANMLKKEDLTVELETAFNFHVVGALKRIIQIALGVGVTAVIAWVVKLFQD